MTYRMYISKLVLVLAALSMTSCKQDENFYSNIQRSDVFVQQYDDSKYDFLWVMDNSGSMKPRRDFVRDNMSEFLTILRSRKAIDFQMAVTTTDVFSASGDLVVGPGSLKVVRSATSGAPASDFGGILDAVTDSPTSFWEQGLEASYQAVFQHKTEFSRLGIPLIVIYLTDEDDWSCEDNCFGVEPEHNATWVPFDVLRYSEFFSNVKSVENTRVHLFPIVGVDTEHCEVASVGSRYMSVAAEVAGFGESGSICTSDLAESFKGIARNIADRGSVFHLSSQSSGAGIHVYVNGVLMAYSPDSYEFEASTNSIIFTGAVPTKGSIIEVTYQQILNN